MDNSELIAIAREVGAPLVEKVLARRIGAENARLARDVVEAIATRAGFADDNPAFREAAKAGDADVRRALVEAEHELAPELIELYAQELEVKAHRFEREERGPLWTWAWRPAGMWLTFVLWIWNAIVLHVANAIWKIALPPLPWEIMLGWTGLYLSLYMGGHTVKAVMTARGPLP